MELGRKLVALSLPPGAGLLAAWDEVWARGDAVLPLRPDLPAPALAALLDALRPHERWHDGGRDALPEPAPLDARTDLVVATSGSSGVRKGVELSRAAVEASARATLARLDAGADDAWLCCLPLDHLAGLQVVLRARLSGAALELHERFDAAAVAAERDVAFVSLVPTMLVRLLDLDVPLPPWRAVLLGGAAPPPGLRRRAEAAGVRVVETYGMTETAGGCVYDGVPLDGVEVRVAGDGRIALRGPTLFHGYRLRPDLTEASLAGRWFATNDRGRLTGGRLEVLGRLDDVIVTGGENVSAGEVESVLERHAGVREAAVLGVPDAEWGERVVALVVPASRDAPSPDELREHVRAALGAAAAPRAVVVVDALPRTGLGKVDRAAARGLLPFELHFN